MATMWMGAILCKWCDQQARAGIEKNGQGKTYRVMCRNCGISSQVGMDLPAGRKVALLLSLIESPGRVLNELADEYDALRSNGGTETEFRSHRAKELEVDEELGRLLEAGLVTNDEVWQQMRLPPA